MTTLSVRAANRNIAATHLAVYNSATDTVVHRYAAPTAHWWERKRRRVIKDWLERSRAQHERGTEIVRDQFGNIASAPGLAFIDTPRGWKPLKPRRAA